MIPKLKYKTTVQVSEYFEDQYEYYLKIESTASPIYDSVHLETIYIGKVEKYKVDDNYYIKVFIPIKYKKLEKQNKLKLIIT